MQSHKKCTRCGEDKSLGEYHQNKDSPDGRHSMCKECKNQYGQRHYSKNREKIRAQQKVYEAENQEQIKKYRERNRDSKIEYARKYRIENKDSLSARQRVYYENNRDKILYRGARYREENRERILEQKRRHWAENREVLIPLQRESYRANREERLESNRRHYSDNSSVLNIIKGNREKEQNEILQSLSFRSGRKWGREEDKILLEHDGTEIYEKAVRLGRTLYACRARLASLRKESNDAT